MAKRDLTFDPPIMNAAGTLGLSADLHSPMDWRRFGVFITNPVSLNKRTPAHGTRYVAYPGGFLLHTGYPNPGVSQVIKHYAKHWAHSPLPVIVHLLAHHSDEVDKMARMLETLEGVNGLELGIPGDATQEQLQTLTRAAAGELPIIVRLPMERSLELAEGAIQAGAMAVSLAPPRGLLPTTSGTLVQGRLFGPSIFPTALKVVRELMMLNIPTIGAGGVYSAEQCHVMLSAGALAVQLDGILWRGCGYKIF